MKLKSPFHINCCGPQFLKHTVYLFLKKKKNNPSSIMVKSPQTETYVDERHSSTSPHWAGCGGGKEKEELNSLHD